MLNYAKRVNAFVERGLREGWDKAGDEPKDPELDDLAQAAIAAVRQANASGEFDALREQWPPAHAPLIPLLEKNGRSIPVLCLLDDGSIVARIGAPYEPGTTVRIDRDRVTDLPGIGFFGQSPNRRYFAYAIDQGIEITDGWCGPRTCLCPWPTGKEDIPDGFDTPPLEQHPTPTRLIPFPDGTRVLLVSQQGIFVLTPDCAHRLLPTPEDMQEHFEWLEKECPEDELTMHLDMDHGAVSNDGRFIAVGSQSSTHLLLDSDLNCVGQIGNLSSYPHYALFNQDSTMVAFNSCHFYNGMTVGVHTRDLPGLETEPYEHDPRTVLLEEGARVYAGVCRNDEFILGDASGYLRAVSETGEHRWQVFVGSSVGDIDISADGKTLAVSTYAGFLAIFDLDTARQAPHQIGTGQHFERRRWVFWKNESKPLIW